MSFIVRVGGGGGGFVSSYTDEQARDAIAAALVAGANVTITPSDPGDTITIAAATSGASGIPAAVVDAKGDLIAGTANDTVARLAAGTDGQVLSANSGAVTGLSWIDSYTDEQVRDVMGAALAAGSNITITPNDGADTITIASTGGGATDPEVVRDTIASALVAGSNITITPNDGADTITIAASGSTAVNAIPVINVKDSPYNATGNGSTDDTAAIQAALNAVPAGGAIVWLPAGRYKVSSTLVIGTAATVMQGAVAGHPTSDYHNIAGTRLEASGTLSGGPMLRAQMAGNTEPLYGCVLRNLTLDGMGTATGAGVHWRSYQSHIEGVHVYQFGSHGFHINGYASWNLYDSIFTKLESAYNSGSGLYLDVGATDLHITSSVIFENNVNFQFRDGSSLQLDDCHFYDPVTHNMFFNGGGSRSKFTNCKIEGAGQHGINIDSTNGGPEDVQFVGCNIHIASSAVTNTYDLAIIQGPSGNGVYKTMFVGCSFGHYGGGATKARYGVNLGDCSQSPMVVGCHFADSAQYATGPVLNNSQTAFPAFIHGNAGTGYVTRRTGTATVASGSTSVAVTHGLSVTPTLANISVTPTNDKGSAAEFWISGAGATTFTINVNTAPGGSGATFAWQAEA